MNWKIALVVFTSLAFCLSACHQEKETKPAPKPKAAECKLAGDWSLDQTGDDVPDNKKRTLTISFNDNREGTIATGTLNVGTRPADDSSFSASASDVRTIEDGGSSSMDWNYGGANASCQVQFVEDCKKLEFSCPDNDTFRIGRK